MRPWQNSDSCVFLGEKEKKPMQTPLSVTAPVLLNEPEFSLPTYFLTVVLSAAFSEHTQSCLFLLCSLLSLDGRRVCPAGRVSGCSERSFTIGPVLWEGAEAEPERRILRCSPSSGEAWSTVWLCPVPLGQINNFLGKIPPEKTQPFTRWIIK